STRSSSRSECRTAADALGWRDGKIQRDLRMNRCGAATRRIVLLVVVAVLIGTPMAFGQDHPKITFDGGVLYSVQRSNTPESAAPSIPHPGIGGSSFGVVAGVAVSAGPIIDFGVEMSDPARFAAVRVVGF